MVNHATITGKLVLTYDYKSMTFSINQARKQNRLEPSEAQ